MPRGRRWWLAGALLALVAVFIAYGVRMGANHPVRQSEPLAGRYDAGTQTLELVTDSCAALTEVHVHVGVYVAGGGPIGDGHWEDLLATDLEGEQRGMLSLPGVVLVGADDLPVLMEVVATDGEATPRDFVLRADLGPLRTFGADASGPLVEAEFADRYVSTCAQLETGPST